MILLFGLEWNSVLRPVTYERRREMISFPYSFNRRVSVRINSSRSLRPDHEQLIRRHWHGWTEHRGTTKNRKRASMVMNYIYFKTDWLDLAAACLQSWIPQTHTFGLLTTKKGKRCNERGDYGTKEEQDE
eukprot:scaffold491_cov160-Amphora_coffeaeformis.AAC.3